MGHAKVNPVCRCSSILHRRDHPWVVPRPKQVSLAPLLLLMECNSAFPFHISLQPHRCRSRHTRSSQCFRVPATFADNVLGWLAYNGVPGRECWHKPSLQRSNRWAVHPKEVRHIGMVLLLRAVTFVGEDVWGYAGSEHPGLASWHTSGLWRNNPPAVHPKKGVHIGTVLLVRVLKNCAAPPSAWMKPAHCKEERVQDVAWCSSGVKQRRVP